MYVPMHTRFISYAPRNFSIYESGTVLREFIYERGKKSSEIKSAIWIYKSNVGYSIYMHEIFLQIFIAWFLMYNNLQGRWFL